MLDPNGTAGMLYDDEDEDQEEPCEWCKTAPCRCDDIYDTWKDNQLDGEQA